MSAWQCCALRGDNSDRYWRFGSGGSKLCLEAMKIGFNAAAVRDMHALLATVRRRPLTICY